MSETAKPANIRNRHWEDIKFHVRIQAETRQARITAYEILHPATPDGGPAKYREHGFTEGDNTTPDIDQAERYLTAHLKWDGCMNVRFNPDGNMAKEFCDAEDVANLGELLKRIHGLGPEVIEAWGPP